MARATSLRSGASKLAAKNRQADESLTRHEAYAGDLARLHENTIRCLTSGLVTVDLAGRVTTANEVAREILGAAPGTLLPSKAGACVACGSGALELLRVKPAGKGEMDGAAWLRGARLVPGARLGDD